MSIHGPASAFFPFSDADRDWKNKNNKTQSERGELSDMSGLQPLNTPWKGGPGVTLLL